MYRIFFIILSISSLSRLNAHLETIKPKIEKIVTYCNRCDEKNTNDKNIFIQPIISMIINKKNDEFNNWLNDTNKHNQTKFIRNYEQYIDISDNINVILLLKYIAKFYNNSLLKTLKDRYKKCYKNENENYNFITQITRDNFNTIYTLSKKEVRKSFEKYLNKLIADVSEQAE